MSLEDLWQQYQIGGCASVADVPTSEPLESFYLAVLHFGQQAYQPALMYAQRAAQQDPADLVYAYAATYLQKIARQGKQAVYTSGEGFAAFIGAGGNVPLYQLTSAALHLIYQQYVTLTVLDIGVGDGRALLPALTDNIRRLDILEPSGKLLEQASRLLKQRGVPHRASQRTLQEFAQEPADSWDIMQATYSLQSISPAERAGLLRWAREHTKRLLIVEFDTPQFSDQYAPDHVRYVVERYRQGLAEYDRERDLVALEFLVPVMFGYFDQTAARTTYEHSLDDWVLQVRAAGFASIEHRLLYSYWWAPAFLLDARPAGER
jgi:hypothetical protein